MLGDAVFGSDVLAISGLDDRESGNKVLERAQELMADAVHAEQAFFSTCGSSLSVKSAMLSVAGPGEKLLVGRDAHKSVVSGLILSGVRPIWVEPRRASTRWAPGWSRGRSSTSRATWSTRVSGYRAADWLREHHRVSAGPARRGGAAAGGGTALWKTPTGTAARWGASWSWSTRARSGTSTRTATS